MISFYWIRVYKRAVLVMKEFLGLQPIKVYGIEDSNWFISKKNERISVWGESGDRNEI